MSNYEMMKNDPLIIRFKCITYYDEYIKTMVLIICCPS